MIVSEKIAMEKYSSKVRGYEHQSKDTDHAADKRVENADSQRFSGFSLICHWPAVKYGGDGRRGAGDFQQDGRDKSA